MLNFSEAPREGLEFGGKLVRIEALCTAHSGTFHRLQRSRGGGLSNWFQIRRPFAEQLKSFKRDYEPEEVAAQVVAYFDEIEAWWRDKSVGPHIEEFK